MVFKSELEACNCIKKTLQHRYFLVNIAKLLRTTYFEEHLRTAASVLLIIKLVIKYLQMVFKSDVLNSFAHGLHGHVLQYLQETPVLQLSFNIVASLEACNCIKKRLQQRRFLVNIAKLLRTIYFEVHLRTAASILLIIKFVIKYRASADLFLLKNITWNGFC